MLQDIILIKQVPPTPEASRVMTAPTNDCLIDARSGVVDCRIPRDFAQRCQQWRFRGLWRGRHSHFPHLFLCAPKLPTCVLKLSQVFFLVCSLVCFLPVVPPDCALIDDPKHSLAVQLQRSADGALPKPQPVVRSLRLIRALALRRGEHRDTRPYPIRRRAGVIMPSLTLLDLPLPSFAHSPRATQSLSLSSNRTLETHGLVPYADEQVHCSHPTLPTLMCPLTVRAVPWAILGAQPFLDKHSDLTLLVFSPCWPIGSHDVTDLLHRFLAECLNMQY